MSGWDAHCLLVKVCIMPAELTWHPRACSYVGGLVPGAAQILGMPFPYAAQQGLPADQVQQVSQAGHRALLRLKGLWELVPSNLQSADLSIRPGGKGSRAV